MTECVSFQNLNETVFKFKSSPLKSIFYLGAFSARIQAFCTFIIASLTFFNISFLLANAVRISLRSEDCNDKGRYRGCGRAYIRVNGKDYSPHKRGHNVVVVDYPTGEFTFSVLNQSIRQNFKVRNN